MKEKLEPIFRLKVKVRPLLVSAVHISRHWAAVMSDIFFLNFLNQKIPNVGKIHSTFTPQSIDRGRYSIPHSQKNSNTTKCQN